MKMNLRKCKCVKLRWMRKDFLKWKHHRCVINCYLEVLLKSVVDSHLNGNRCKVIFILTVAAIFNTKPPISFKFSNRSLCCCQCSLAPVSSCCVLHFYHSRFVDRNFVYVFDSVAFLFMFFWHRIAIGFLLRGVFFVKAITIGNIYRKSSSLL